MAVKPPIGLPPRPPLPQGGRCSPPPVPPYTNHGSPKSRGSESGDSFQPRRILRDSQASPAAFLTFDFPGGLGSGYGDASARREARTPEYGRRSSQQVAVQGVAVTKARALRSLSEHARGSLAGETPAKDSFMEVLRNDCSSSPPPTVEEVTLAKKLRSRSCDRPSHYSARERPSSTAASTPEERSSSKAASAPEERPSSKAARRSAEAAAKKDVAASNPTRLPGRWAVSLASSSAPRKKEPKRSICLLKSVFSGRPPVLVFDYEPECGASSRNLSRIFSSEDLEVEGFLNTPKMFFTHVETSDCHEYRSVVNSMQHGGLYRIGPETGKWCIYWGDIPKPEFLRSLNPFQKANHFPSSWNLGRKDLVWKNIARMKRKWPQEFNITPTTFVLPEDHQAWLRAREQSPNAFWIHKPVCDACGRGIRLYSSKSAAAEDAKFSQKAGVVQRYLDQPLLINGFKFDLRVYVVVTSYDPLKVYLNPEGLVRLATEPYTLSHDNLGVRTMHLTNFSINKHSEAYVPNLDCQGNPAPEAGSDDPDVECDSGSAAAAQAPSSSKWSFKQLREYLGTIGKDYDVLFQRIKDVVIKTLISVETPIVNACQQGANFSSCGAAQQVGPNQTCFEVYGFDVMVDDKLKPWLLEVNIFPSLASSSPLDKRIKTQLASDVLTLVGVMPFSRDLVERTMKEEHMRRLQGMAPRAGAISRSHAAQSVGSASLKELGEGEWQMILDTHDEYMRRGLLERIHPATETLKQYSEFFATPRYASLLLDRWLELGGESCFLPENRNQIPNWVPQQVCFDAC
eukprot:TRINITY_DN62229_c0_g1_i1.p1 TRINITY_DN62229_c0_g1~~TRINITY_DN62229_c0_g1_i1.p1  ORF type:complete len:798 (+),score=142.35 TRINITY_DN62229_c0_g1_i1:72-2465(+)